MSGKCVKSAPSSSFTDIQDRFFSATTYALNSAGGLSNIYGQKDDLNNFVLSGTRRGNVFYLRHGRLTVVWMSGVGKISKNGFIDSSQVLPLLSAGPLDIMFT